MPVYTFNATNPVSVGQATKKSHYDRLWDNVMAIKQGDAPLNWLRVSSSGDTASGGHYIGGINSTAFLNIVANHTITGPNTAYGMRLSGTISVSSGTSNTKYGFELAPTLVQG